MLINNKKILVISHNSLSYENANGRSILNLLDYSDSNLISNISLFSNTSTYINDENHLDLSEYKIIFNQLSINKVYLKNIRGRKEYFKKSSFIDIFRKIAKNKTIKNLIRYNVWKKYSYITNTVFKFIEKIEPDILLYQPGDFYALNQLVNEIVDNYHMPIILYITEDYFLKGKKYFKPFGYGWEKYKKSFIKLFTQRVFTIYANEKLKIDYSKKLNVKNKIIYISSDIISEDLINSKINLSNEYSKSKVGYFGNLGLDRFKSILKFSNYLQVEYPQFIIYVYSACKDKKIIKKLKRKKNIKFCGFVNYNELKKLMISFDFLLLAEAEEGKYIKNLKYAFSTKIADYLALNKIILSIGSKDIAIINYLVKNNSTIHFDSLKEINLTEKINYKYYENLLKNSTNLYKLNHNKLINQKKFNEIISEMLTI